MASEMNVTGSESRIYSTISPVIKALSPNEGWVTGGETITVIGENFFPGLQIVFGSTAVWGEVSDDICLLNYLIHCEAALDTT
ncbi:unnamed protein product [Schistosoma curassoni]|uniref:IPT/TIG domain-containing protein n=1 Tax=Schistosoma curassoni TaxID=6186 RepID=A0A183KQ95_9TREM|nr:unnamed protein product [Schistosoma curassoni]